MPRFFFDMQDGEHFSRDDDGLEFPDAKTARDNAVLALPDIARDAMPDGDSREFSVILRDATGTPILRARLLLQAEWLDGEPASADAPASGRAA